MTSKTPKTAKIPESVPKLVPTAPRESRSIQRIEVGRQLPGVSRLRSGDCHTLGLILHDSR